MNNKDRLGTQIIEIYFFLVGVMMHFLPVTNKAGFFFSFSAHFSHPLPGFLGLSKNGILSAKMDARPDKRHAIFLTFLCPT